MQVFVSNDKLLLQFSLPCTWQLPAGAPETPNLKLGSRAKLQPSFWLRKLVKHKAFESGDYADANANASAVKAFHCSHYQTQIKHSSMHPKQVKYDDSLLRRILVSLE